ncbi:flagellar hook-length control protein FliK [Alkalithermobacter paradoxus]|uniref:Flagellar hook-length control protein-like C-terminal domain-containing protein n=1 Tax=Alkalithermobacter paradoxus TaxID=29349 RepID=A0A1V4I6Y0_9FIRM|nr:hypothetical protein CLOTH_13980 [[Clostridium] thermoalcaliphilum]
MKITSNTHYCFIPNSNISTEDTKALVEKHNSNEQIDLSLNKLINDLNVPNTKENEEIIKQMIKENITVNKENFKTIKENLSSFKALSKFSNEEIKLLNESIDDIENKEVRQVLREIYINKNGKNIENILSDLKSINLEEKDLIFLFKNNLKLNYQNIKTLDDFLKKGENLEKTLDKLYQIVSNSKETSKCEIKAIIKNIIKDLSYSKEINLNEIKNNLELLAKKINIKERIYSDKEELSQINDRLNFLNTLSNESMYFQIPFQYNGYKNLAEITLSSKKSKTSKNKKEISIFISLNTHNLGKVESLLGYCDNRLNITFSSENEKIINMFKKNESKLINNINSIGIKDININYKVKLKDRFNILEETKIDYANFDIRV